MRRLISILLGVVVLVAVVPCLFAGEIIDGVAATVDRRPILRSDWDEAVRFEAFMHQKRLADVSESERVAALQRLIDRRLLDAQMADEGALRPSGKALKADVAKLREQFAGAGDDAHWQARLRSYGLTEATLEAHLREQVRVMNFIDVQLRPNVRIQDAEVQAYYQKQLLADLRQAGARLVPFAEIEPKIRELLVQQRMDELLDAWLHNLRQQSHVQTLVPLPSLNAALTRASADGGK
jgi:hypothetical protein